jgi:hypothetical protein
VELEDRVEPRLGLRCELDLNGDRLARDKADEIWSMAGALEAVAIEPVELSGPFGIVEQLALP